MSETSIYFAIEEVQDVTIAKFLDQKIIDDDHVDRIGKSMFAIVDTNGRKKIILDFSSVEYMTSKMLHKLIVLSQKLKKEGKLAFCNVCAGIHEVLIITQLHKLFVIKNNLEEALTDMAD